MRTFEDLVAIYKDSEPRDVRNNLYNALWNETVEDLQVIIEQALNSDMHKKQEQDLLEAEQNVNVDDYLANGYLSDDSFLPSYFGHIQSEGNYQKKIATYKLFSKQSDIPNERNRKLIYVEALEALLYRDIEDIPLFIYVLEKASKRKEWTENAKQREQEEKKRKKEGR